MSGRPLRVADLFCGAGGTSTGLARAAEASGRSVELLAVNHWEIAVATHAANHPRAKHVHAPLEGIDPKSAVGSRKLDVLVASPECTHHSSARGGRPINDQSRASAWHVLSWAQAVEPEWIIVENVPEFRTWGPIGRNGRPMKSRRGETFAAWVLALESLGYKVAHRVLNAADYGDPTTRRRLFVIARRGRGSPGWPAATHRDPRLSADLFSSGVAPWRTAREAVIDWNLRGSSIFGRKRPLAEATLRRIAEGIRRFAGAHAEDFLVLLRGTGSTRTCDAPLPALTAGGTHVGLASYLVPFYGERPGQPPRTHDVAAPLPTVTCDPRFGIANLVRYNGTGGPVSVEEPLPAATTRDRFGLAQPFIAQVNHGDNPTGGPRGNASRVRSADEPLPTVTASSRGLAVVEPFMLGQQSGGAPRPVSAPVPTLATDGAVSLVAPFVLAPLGIGRGNAPRSVEQPAPTVLASRGGGHLVEPLADGGRVLDIMFRMLQPHELAAAMGFPADYQFKGNRGDVVRQIGNAVPVGVATALCAAALEQIERRCA